MGAGKSGEASIILRVVPVAEMRGEHGVRRAGRMKRRTRQKERESSWMMMDLSIFFDQPSSVCCTYSRASRPCHIVFSSHTQLFFKKIDSIEYYYYSNCKV